MAGIASIADLPVIDGVAVHPLRPTDDARGRMTEVWRASSGTAVSQWNLVSSGPGALRGLRWHGQATDRLVLAAGRVLVALADVRRGSPTEGAALLAWWDSEDGVELVIGPGVLHGWWTPASSTVLIAFDREWSGTGDDGGVRFDDPGLGLPWPEDAREPILSEWDAGLPLLADAARPCYRPASSNAPRIVAND